MTTHARPELQNLDDEIRMFGGYRVYSRYVVSDLDHKPQGRERVIIMSILLQLSIPMFAART